MKYHSGETVEIGDRVLIEHRRTEGVVISIVEDESSMAEWNVEEEGLLLESPVFGKVFWPVKDERDPVIFLSRA